METKTSKPERLSVGQGKKREPLQEHEVIYLEGDCNYTRFIRKNKPTLTASITLSRYEKKLANFIRIHKQYIVNPRHVKKWVQCEGDTESVLLELSNGSRLPIARRRIRETRERLFSK